MKKKLKKKRRLYFPRAKKSLEKLSKKYERFIPFQFDRKLLSLSDLGAGIVHLCPFEKGGEIHIAYFDLVKVSFEVRNLSIEDESNQVIHREQFDHDSLHLRSSNILFFPSLESLVIFYGKKYEFRNINNFEAKPLPLERGSIYRVGDGLLGVIVRGSMLCRIVDLTHPRFRIFNLPANNKNDVDNSRITISSMTEAKDGYILANDEHRVTVINYKDENRPYVKRGEIKTEPTENKKTRKKRDTKFFNFVYSKENDVIFSVTNHRVHSSHYWNSYVESERQYIEVYSKILDLSTPSFEFIKKIEIDEVFDIQSLMYYRKFLILQRKGTYRLGLFDIGREKEITGSFSSEYPFQDNYPNGHISLLQWTNSKRRNYFVMKASKSNGLYGWKNLMFDEEEFGRKEVRERLVDMLEFYLDQKEEEEEENEGEDDERRENLKIVFDIKFWNSNIVVYKFLLF